MNEASLVMTAVAVAAIIVGAVVVLLEHRKTKRIMNTLNQMLDSALAGSFTENCFDESLLSAVECRLNRYLSASTVSARNLMAEKEKIKELLADISHQTKTPIANVLLYAQLLEEQKLPQESLDLVAALRGQAEKLSFLIASLMKMSRLETGVFTLQPVFRAIDPMLEEACGQMAPKAARKGVSLITNPTEAKAVFDYKWTTEALGNLIDNAIKYTPAGGRIQIAVKEYDLFCCIDVADTGIGISEEDQAKVFCRFYRSPAVSEQDGVGIGLYLTRQILAGQGGYIKVTSSLGCGSVFSIYLPRKA